MSKVSDQQEDLLTDYGTATTAYLLMAMSIDSLERRNKQLEDENTKLREELESVGTAAYLYGRSDLKTENAKLRELATYALKHIIEFECEEPDRERLRGKPCEDCADYGSSDCPKCMPRMFGVSGIEVD